MLGHLSEIIVTLAAYYIFSSAADAMLPPLQGQERTFYGWCFRFIQNLAANASRAMAAKYPQLVDTHLTETDTVVRQRDIAATSGKGN